MNIHFPFDVNLGVQSFDTSPHWFLFVPRQLQTLLKNQIMERTFSSGRRRNSELGVPYFKNSPFGYGSIPFLGGWTSIYQLFWCSPGVLLVLTHPHLAKLKEPDRDEKQVASSDATCIDLQGFGVVAVLECTATWLRLARENLELVLEKPNQSYLGRVDASRFMVPPEKVDTWFTTV